MFRPDPIYEFPPFFTRQPNEDTWKTQREAWSKILPQYCQSEGRWTLARTSPVFENPRIQRRLHAEAVDELFAYMCEQGLAERASPSEIYVYREKPAELANILAQWANQSGNTGSVMTFYELIEEGYPGLDVFRNIDTYLLQKAVDILVKQGKAASMKDGGETVGLKFA